MLKKSVFIFSFLFFAFISIKAQTASETVMVLPFENTSDKAEFNWVGESIADSLTELLKNKGLNVISNQERKIIQQRLKVPLTILPSTATSLKLARESKSSVLIFGKYKIIPEQADTAASVSITTKIIRVNEGRFLREELDGKSIIRDIDLTDALGNLQTIQGQIAYSILSKLFKSSLAYTQNEIIQSANTVPARAFEAYIKGLLTTTPEARENYFKNAVRIYGEEKENKIYSAAALELGHFYLNQKKNQEAVEQFSRIPQEDGTYYAEAAFYTGLMQWQQQNYEQALAVLRPLAEDLKMTSVYNTLGAIAVQAAREDKKNKGKSDALLTEGVGFLKKVVDSAPDEMNFRFNYGLALFLNKNYKEAAEQFKPILAANPQDGETYFLLAKSQESLGDEKAAENDNNARRFLTLNNRYAKLQDEWQRGKTVENVALRVAQPSRREFVSVVLTKKQAQTAVQAPQSDTEKMLAEAREYYKAGRDDDSMTVLRRIQASEPMSAETYLMIGLIFLRRGDLEQSVSNLKTALFWDNRLTDAQIALGKIFIQKGDCLQAKTYSAAALENAPENEEVLGLQRQVERCSK